MHDPTQPKSPVPLAPGEVCDVSPTQISTYRSCKRKWAFQKLLGLRHDTAATIRGKKVHALRERALISGDPIDQTTIEGQIAATGFHEVTKPPTFDIAVEYEFRHAITNTLRWHGIMDVIAVNDSPYPWITDHKTTANLRYAKSEAGLRSDPQWNIYAEVALRMFPEAAWAYLTWHYLTTKKPFVHKPVTLIAMRESSARIAEVGSLIATSKEIEKIRRNPPTDCNDLTPNTMTCGDYGGCPFRGAECRAGIGSFFQFTKDNLSSDLVSLGSKQTKESNMSIMQDRLAAFRAKQGGKVNPTVSDDVEETAEETAESAPVRRGPGRPPGSKNKPKEETTGGAGSIDLSPIVAILEKIHEDQKATNEEIKLTLQAYRISIGFEE